MRTLVKKLDFYVPLEKLAKNSQKERLCAFLDSSLTGERGRYSILGKNPCLTVWEQDGQCFQNGAPAGEPMEVVLERYLKDNREENPADLPLAAGAIGYFSYDYGRKFENVAGRHPQNIKMPDAWFTFYDNLIIEDCLEKEIYITARGIKKDPESSCRELTEWAQRCSKIQDDPIPARHGKLASFQADFEKEEYQRAIDDMMEYIRAGDIYIANMTQRLFMDSRKDPYDVFRYLRSHNPSPFGAYLNYGDFQIVCASPERFLQVRGGQVQTRPVKGTRKRGETRQEDERLRQELAQSEKDRSELLMIVDLIRAAFPGGSITGAPKIRAMEIIDELEHSRRGLYTGSIGYLSLDGSCDLNIVIRTAVYQDGRYHLGVGGGITCESDTEFEYEETLQKAKAIREAVYECEAG